MSTVYGMQHDLHFHLAKGSPLHYSTTCTHLPVIQSPVGTLALGRKGLIRVVVLRVSVKLVVRYFCVSKYGGQDPLV